MASISVTAAGGAILVLWVLFIPQPVQAAEDVGPADECDDPHIEALVGFDKEPHGWRVTTDGVMGGVSQGVFMVSEGNGIFKGRVSLENNGGFVLVRRYMDRHDLSAATGVAVRVRGDGKRYSFRLNTSTQNDGVSYELRFDTQQDTWQTLYLPFDRFRAVYRGRSVPNAAPFDPSAIRGMGLLIADKQAGPFQLEIAWIQSYDSQQKG